MKTPPYLKKGDKIVLLSPASKIKYKRVKPAINVYRSWGLNVQIGKHTFNEFYTFSAEATERKNDFQAVLDDESIKAIFCTRGGYGSIQIINGLDFSKFNQSPKWIVGYSDITVFHIYMNFVLEYESLHGLMSKDFYDYLLDNQYVESQRKLLFGENIMYKISSHKLNKPGKATGILVGGNLSTIISLLGTRYLNTIEGKILFIEDVGEHLYRLDRMMNQFKLSGILGKIKALIVGGMTKMKSKTEFGKNPIQIIDAITEEYNYPIVYNFPAGHQKKNYSLILGRKVFLKITKSITILSYKN